MSETRLSGLQLAILRILWDAGEATVNQVHDGLTPRRKLAPTTVATLLKRLEKRGLLAHRMEGRQFVYRPLVSADEIGQSMVTELRDDLFAGKASDLVAHLLASRDIAPGDLAHIKKMIEDHERGQL